MAIHTMQRVASSYSISLRLIIQQEQASIVEQRKEGNVSA